MENLRLRVMEKAYAELIILSPLKYLLRFFLS